MNSRSFALDVAHSKSTQNCLLTKVFFVAICQVVYCMDRCIAICTECKKFKIQKADCLAMLKRYQEAQEIAK